MAYGHEFFQVIKTNNGAFNTGTQEFVLISTGAVSTVSAAQKITIPALTVDGVYAVDITVDTPTSIEYIKNVTANITGSEYIINVVNIVNTNAGMGDTRSTTKFSLRIRNAKGVATPSVSCIVTASLEHVKYGK